MAHNIITLTWFNVVFINCDHGIGHHTSTFFSRIEEIYVLHIQIQSKMYISKSNANPKTKSCLNSNSSDCY